MSKALYALFESEIAQLGHQLGGREDHARFLFDDLVAAAARATRAHGAPFCLALRAAVIAFQVDFAHSRDAAVAHTAATARLEVLGLSSGGSR